MANTRKNASKRTTNTAAASRKRGNGGGGGGSAAQAGAPLPKWPLTGPQTRSFLNSMSALTPYLQGIVAKTGRKASTSRGPTQIKATGRTRSQSQPTGMSATR